eukprot:TRINITY_DN12305_c0_g1_i2.p1 TRINITY_DN12305_c0_g1~~TRINITY_DN12305_c0_g1_i2.p1  ORF type:complete len:2283 (+),score=522.25 TRINITY_DN12305_c0_g1_i2:52-6849(+)
MALGAAAPSLLMSRRRPVPEPLLSDRDYPPWHSAPSTATAASSSRAPPPHHHHSAAHAMLGHPHAATSTAVPPHLAHLLGPPSPAASSTVGGHLLGATPPWARPNAPLSPAAAAAVAAYGGAGGSAAAPSAAEPGAPLLRRSEFVRACRALLEADGDLGAGGALTDLEGLADLLDPQCTGFVSLDAFSRLLEAHRDTASTQRRAAAAAALSTPGPSMPGSPAAGAPAAASSALDGLRLWMSQHGWLIQDLEHLLGGPTARLDLRNLETRLLACVQAPWITPQGVREIFAQLRVRGGERGGSDAVRAEDLVAALLDDATFRAELEQRCVRVIFREAYHRQPRIELGQLCRAADARRVGVLSLDQLAAVLEGVCPGLLARADIQLLYRKFAPGGLPGGSGFRYEAFVEALNAERVSFAEHLLLRALPELIRRAGEFETLARETDLSGLGTLSHPQLANVLSKLGLGLCDSGLKELDDFLELLPVAIGQRPGAFEYGKVVQSGTWNGPSLEAAVANVRGGGQKPVAAAGAKRAPKAYLVPILYYRLAQGAQKLQLSAERTFERLDRGGKGHLTAEDLRLAVLDVLGLDETLADLGLDPAAKIWYPEFASRMNFDMQPLRGRAVLERVFRGEAAIAEGDFCARLTELDIDPVTAKSWLQLIYPAALPAAGVERSCCETFLTTHTDAAPPRDASTGSSAERRRRLQAAKPGLRKELLASLAPADLPPGGATGPIRAWLRESRAAELLGAAGSGGLRGADCAELLAEVARFSRNFAAPATSAAADAEAKLRTETLLAFAEAYCEHLLEVSLTSVNGLDCAQAPAVAGGKDKELELALRYRCHGTDYTAETADMRAGKGAQASSHLDFAALHTFGLSCEDDLAELFEGCDEAMTVQAWAGAAVGSRQLLAIAALPAAELRAFLATAAAARGAPEALLGSQKTWTLSFQKPPQHFAAAVGDPAGEFSQGSVAISVVYRRRTPVDPSRPPLPWSSTFSGRSVLCRRAAGQGSGADGEESWRPAPPATAELSDTAKEPEPGSAQVALGANAFQVRPAAMRPLLAQCLGGAASGGGPTALLPAAASKPPGEGMGLFVRVCPFLGQSSLHGGAWEQSALVPVPVVLLTPRTDGEAEIVSVDVAFSCKSPPLQATEAVAALLDRTVALELWVRAAAPTGAKLAADVRLAEASVKLVELLRMVSPDEPTEPRLRMLRPGQMDVKVDFKRDDALLAQLDLSIALELPGGPSVVTWSLPKPKEPNPPKPPAANYKVRLCEAIFTKQFSAATASSASASTAAVARAPLLYVEAGDASGGPSGKASFRSAPMQGVEDQWGLVRVALADDARVELSERPILGISTAMDLEVRSGRHHSLFVRVVNVSREPNSSAEAMAHLPYGGESGLPSTYFLGRVWLPLFHVGVSDPTLSAIGRILVEVEVDGVSDQGSRVCCPSMMPSGVWLPSYSSWSAASDGWALESTLRAAIGEELWAKLVASEDGKVGAVASDGFREALLATCQERAAATAELGFLDSIAHSFLSPQRLAPYKQLLHWLLVRRLASVVLPCAGRLLKRLRDADRASGSDSGTVPLATLLESLRTELSRSERSLSAAEWEFVSQRPQWRLASPAFSIGGHFDYLTFFWDLHAAGANVGDMDPAASVALAALPAAVPAAAPAPVTSAAASGPCIEVQVKSALHLPRMPDGSSPATRLELRWAAAASTTSAVEVAAAGEAGDAAFAGRSAWADPSLDPVWNYRATLPLPVITGFNGDGDQLFDRLALHVRILRRMGREGAQGTAEAAEDLLGVAVIDLSPLRRGFPSVDGYFHVQGLEAAADDDGCSTSLSEPRNMGQVRATVSPALRLANDDAAVVADIAPAAAAASGSAAGVLPSLQDQQQTRPLPKPTAAEGGGLPRCWLFGPQAGAAAVTAPLSAPAAGAAAVATGTGAGTAKLRLTPSPAAGLSSSAAVVAAAAGAGALAASATAALASASVTPRVPSVFVAEGKRDAELRAALWPGPVVPFAAERSLADVRLGSGGAGVGASGVEDDVSETALRFATRLSDTELRLRSIDGSDATQMEQLRAKHRENLATLDRLQQSMLPAVGEPAAVAAPGTAFGRRPSPGGTGRLPRGEVGGGLLGAGAGATGSGVPASAFAPAPSPAPVPPVPAAPPACAPAPVPAPVPAPAAAAIAGVLPAPGELSHKEAARRLFKQSACADDVVGRDSLAELRSSLFAEVGQDVARSSMSSNGHDGGSPRLGAAREALMAMRRRMAERPTMEFWGPGPP